MLGPKWLQDAEVGGKIDSKFAKSRQTGAKIGQIGGQVGHKMFQLRIKLALTLATFDRKMANLAASWFIFRILNAILAKIAQVLKRASLWRSGYKLGIRAVSLDAPGSY